MQRQTSRAFPYLPQHLVVLYVVDLVGADLSFQSVLVELAADVDQQGGGAGVNVAAHRHVADVPRNVDAVAQDHADENAWERMKRVDNGGGGGINVGLETVPRA